MGALMGVGPVTPMRTGGVTIGTVLLGTPVNELERTGAAGTVVVASGATGTGALVVGSTMGWMVGELESGAERAAEGAAATSGELNGRNSADERRGA